MKAAVCMKGPKEKAYVATCDLEPHEFRRLISDFETYRKMGFPLRGEYRRATVKTSVEEVEKVSVEFEKVVLIIADPTLSS